MCCHCQTILRGGGGFPVTRDQLILFFVSRYLSILIPVIWDYGVFREAWNVLFIRRQSWKCSFVWRGLWKCRIHASNTIFKNYNWFHVICELLLLFLVTQTPFPSLNIDRKKLFVPFNPTYSYFWGNLKFILCKLTRRIVFLCKFLCFYLATVLPVKQFNIRTKHGRLYLSISKKYCSLNKFFIPFCSSLLSCFEYPLYCISKSRSLQGYDIDKDLLTYIF